MSAGADPKEGLQLLMDVFTGVDGGVNYLKLRILLEEQFAKRGTDPEAAKICEIFTWFVRLVQYASGLNMERKQ